jgi:xylulokinase
MTRLALGLDSSTQSLTAVVVNIDTRKVVYEKSLNYRADKRLDRFGLNEDYILPPQEDGEANQPATMYFASLDAICEDMKEEFPDYNLGIGDIAVINTSGQQHGHVLLNKQSQQCFDNLKKADFSPKASLVTLLKPSLAVPFARIWKTSCTLELASEVREDVGGIQNIIELTGSNAPWRFSAFGIMKTGRDFSEEYGQTLIIHQISSLIPAVLAGNVSIPLDYGNACGTSLMDYRKKQWAEELIRSVSKKLPGYEEGLLAKLPKLSSGKSIVGTIAEYFVRRYGFDPQCAIGIGSGDNPQTKVLIAGSLLSLGTGFVNMVETDGQTLDMKGYTNAMYDAFDRPFMFGCRANGALRWDNVRTMHGFRKQDYKPAEQALRNTPPGNHGRMFLWHADNESFPLSGSFDAVRVGYDEPEFASDYAGIIESCLASVYLHSKYFMTPGKTIYVASGPAASTEIMRRVAAIWNRKAIPIEKGGAALGAAVSGAYALALLEGGDLDPAEFGSSFLQTNKGIEPRPEDVEAYHGDKSFLKTFEKVEAELLEAHPN